MPDDTSPPVVPPPPPSGPQPSPSEKDARTWNMLCHLSALCGLLGVPFGNVLGPLIIWLVKKNEIPSVDVHGKAALNFQITVSILVYPLAIIGVLTVAFFCIGFIFLIPALIIGLCGLVFAII